MSHNRRYWLTALFLSLCLILAGCSGKQAAGSVEQALNVFKVEFHVNANGIATDNTLFTRELGAGQNKNFVTAVASTSSGSLLGAKLRCINDKTHQPVETSGVSASILRH